MTTRHPQQSVNIAQATGAALDIRFQVVAGTVVSLMAFLLLNHLGVEKLRGGPEAIAEDMFLHLQKQCDIAADHPRFNQVGGDGQVRQPFQQAFFQGSHTVADFQLQIPQQGDKFPHALGLLFIQAAQQAVDKVTAGRYQAFGAGTGVERCRQP
ncbi:hypothetical protein D3C75_949030 [compost metagenome]